MAARLIEQGFEVVAWNRSAAPAAALRERGARVAASAAEALDAEVVITMLADDGAVEAVWLEHDLVARMPSGAVHLNMASVSLRLAQRLIEMHAGRLSPPRASSTSSRRGRLRQSPAASRSSKRWAGAGSTSARTRRTRTS
jgi:hypothetical protein